MGNQPNFEVLGNQSLRSHIYDYGGGDSWMCEVKPTWDSPVAESIFGDDLMPAATDECVRTPTHAPTEKDPVSPEVVVDLMSPSPYNPELYPDNQLGLYPTSSAKTSPPECVSPVRETWAKIMVSYYGINELNLLLRMC